MSFTRRGNRRSAGTSSLYAAASRDKGHRAAPFWKRPLGIIATVIVLALLGGFIYLFGAQFGHMVARMLASGTWALYAGLIFGIVMALVAFRRYDEGKHFASILATGGVVALGGILVATMVFPYLRLQAVYNESVQVVTEEQAPSFKQRQPFDVASAVSNRTLGDVQGNATGVIKSVPAHDIFTTSIERRGPFLGYESIQQMTISPFGTTGNSGVQTCDFSESAKLRFGGFLPVNNLKRAIYWKTSPTTQADMKDSVFVCEDDKPMIYVPLTKVEGFPFGHPVPGGVAVYDGSTGDLTIQDEYKGDLPLYPSSVAEYQRKSTQARESWWRYMTGRAGFEDTSKDEEDPNGENRAEFSLGSEDGKTSYYVTPLTPRGASSNIVALGTVTSDAQVKAGELNPYTIYRYPSEEVRQANSSVATTITGDILAGYKSSGLKVFEVVPAEDGSWVASIGKEQSTLYRAVIAVGSITLYNESGDVVGTNAKPVEGEEGDESAASTAKELSEMSDEELVQLIKDASDELGSRTGD